jgi:hypothetical protein
VRSSYARLSYTRPRDHFKEANGFDFEHLSTFTAYSIYGTSFLNTNILDLTIPYLGKFNIKFVY